jgi:predicted transcriptional regulator
MSSLERYVIDVMTPNPVIIGANTSIWAAECLAAERDVHHLVVMDHYEIVGEVCRCDLMRAEATAPVESCMKPPITIDDQRTLDDALGLMSKRGVGCLPVVDWSGFLHGVITRRDLLSSGIVSPKQVRTCTNCGSAHGLGPETHGDEPTLCARCATRDSERPKYVTP